jgi:hypothetical protein
LRSLRGAIVLSWGSPSQRAPLQNAEHEVYSERVQTGLKITSAFSFRNV